MSAAHILVVDDEPNIREIVRRLKPRLDVEHWIAFDEPAVAGDPDFENPLTTVCRGCHGDESDEVQCSGSDGRRWKQHLTEGRVAESTWETVSVAQTGSTCGW